MNQIHKNTLHTREISSTANNMKHIFLFYSLWQVAADYLDQCPQNGRYIYQILKQDEIIAM